MLTGHQHRFAVCFVLLLAACGRGGDEAPSVVLERAATAAQQLQSAAFDGQFSYGAPTSGLSARGAVMGTLADGGKRLSFGIDAEMTMGAERPAQTVEVIADVIVAGENETYVKLSKVDGSVLLLPGVGLVPEELLDRWLSLGSGSASGSDALTPDPSLIALQTQTITVTKDRSYEEIDGHRCYAYDVTLDPAKTMAFLERIATERGETFDRGAAETFIASYEARGTIWIDAATSVIRRITWIIDSAPGSARPMDASFTLHLHKHNEPVEITPPTGAVPFENALPDASLPAL